MPGVKQCGKCKRVKFLNDFGRGGRRSQCLRCDCEYYNEYSRNNPDKVREISRKYSRNNPDKVRESNREYRATKAHNITRPQRDWLLIVEQSGLCAVCKALISDIEAYVDHDHTCCPGSKSCGACVRGLVHNICNNFVGAYETKSHVLHHGLSPHHPMYPAAESYVQYTKLRGDWRPLANEAIALGWTADVRTPVLVAA